MKKLIFFEGVDGAGKTFKAKQLLDIIDNPFIYFRSNYQINSEFAGEKINLEESLKHDWRILYDFINQICTDDKTILVDRGFISSIVYGSVFRNDKNVMKMLDVYLKLYSSISEFWFFIREDVENMSEDENKINEYYKQLITNLKLNNDINIKIFIKTADGKFKTDGFLNLFEEMDSKRLDIDYYSKIIDNILRDLSFYETHELIVSDLDGTIVKEGYPKTTELIPLINNIEFINKHKSNYLLLITGREKCIPTPEELKNIGLKKNIRIIGNNKNYGLSSRVLKEYSLNYLKTLGIPITYFDDRKDVMKWLFGNDYRTNNQFDGYIANIN